MNLDAVSLALAHISFTIKTLSKSNFKSSISEISNLISEYGFEAERHLYRTLLTYIDLQSIEENNSTLKRSDNIHLNYLQQEISSLISKPNFITLICYAFDTAITQKSFKISSPSNGFLTILCKLLKLNHAQELVFVLALQNSIHIEVQMLVHEHIQKRLPEFIQTIIEFDHGLKETGLTDLSVEVLHSLLIQIQQYASNESSIIKAEQYEQLLNLLRKEYPIERIGNNNLLILLPILYPSNIVSNDLTSTQILSDSSNLSTLVWQMDGMLSDVILEMGYDFTSSIEHCRNALVHFGLQELKPSTIARILSSMIKTHSGLTENTSIYDSNGVEMITNNDKNSSQTWNVDTFVIAINDLVPTVNWKDVVKEFDHPGFLVRDRQALILLVTALRRALPPEQYIDLLYGRWNNVEGQLSWLAQAIRYPDVFCFGDHPAHPVLIDCLKHPLDDTKETWTWRSLNLIECLLRIADTGLYPIVLEIFKHGIQRSGELIFLGLLQLHTVWTTLKQELLQLIIPTFLANSPNANPLLNYMWNSQHHTTPLRTTLLTALAEWYNRSNDNEQQQRLSRVLEIVQDLKALPVLLAAQPITFILDLACLASRRGYLKLDKWLSDKLREHQDLFIQTTVQYLRKKAPQLSSKDDTNYKQISNIETINILLTVLQLALPSITNLELIQEIQTMISTAKILNNLTSTRSETFHSTLTHPFTPSPTNGLSLSTQLRSLQSSNNNDSSIINEISDVDVYFKRLYCKTTNLPPITVDEFLDVMTKCKDSTIQREREVFQNGIRNLFEEYKFYPQYPERELLLTAQLFGGFFERGLFQNQVLIAAFRVILEGLKKPVGSNLWTFSVTALNRCKTRIREQPAFLQALRNLPTYSELPSAIVDYLDYNSKSTISQTFDSLRTLTPTSNLPSQPVATSPHSHMFSRMNSVPAMTTTNQPQPFNPIGKDNIAQKGPSLTQNANIRTLINDPSYNLVRIKQPPEHINDKIAFTFNNLSVSNLSQKAQELKDLLNNDEQLWKWVAQYLVIKRVSLEHNFHSLYAGFLSTVNMNVLFDTVLIETHRNIKILLLSDKQINNIPDRSLLKNLGHWLGMITIGRNKPILATDLEMKSLIIEAYHMGPQELLYIIPFVSKILESCAKSKIFQQPNPWLMGIMSILAEMHGTPDFKLNLKFEIEVLCKQLEIQLNELPIHHILINKDYYDKIEKQLSNPSTQIISVPAPITPSPQPSSSTTTTTTTSTITTISEPQFRLSDFKPSTFQSLSSMLKINSNIALFRLHPHLKTHTYSPIEQAINESFQTVQRSLKVATTAAETIARKDFLLNPDEQQLRTSARNMVAYLSSGLVLITARSALQEQIQSFIKSHFSNVLGMSQTSTINNNEQTTATTNEMIQQAANEIATSNIELCCCLLQRITISRAIQLIDQRLLSDIELRQRCRAEGRQLPITNTINEERLPEQIRLHHGPFSPHQLAIYEDFVHFIPGFKPNDSEKRDLTTMDESVPSVWDRLISDIDQTIQSQRNQLFTTALQRLLESVNLLRSNLQNQTSTNAPQVALTNLLNIILYNYLEHYTVQSQMQDNESFERFKTIHMNVLKLLIEIRLPLAFINKQLTKSWLECINEFKFNIFAVHHLIRNRLLDIRQIDVQMSQLIDSGSNSALHFAVSFLRNCVIEQPCCSDNDIPLMLDSLHRISLIGKQPAEAVRDLLEIIRLNYTSLTDSNDNKIDKLAILSLSVINNGMKYLSIDDIETVTIVNKAKHILNDWVALTMQQTNRISQQQAFQEFFSQMTLQGIFRSDDTIAKFLRTTIQLCINNVYDVVQQNSSSTQQQLPQYVRCHQGIDSLCRFLYLLTVHTSDNNNYGARIHLINCILGLLATLCVLDHEERGDQFHPLAYQRIILNLFQESTNAVSLNVTSPTSVGDNTSSNDQVMYYVYLAFTNCLHLLRPQRVTGFAFAWLEIVAHRTLMSRFLLYGGRYFRQIQNMYSLLLVDALRLVAPFIRSGENTQSFQVYYKGILKTFMLLLHDFPEFLCEHYYEFCDSLPLISHQLRNIILSSFPKHIRCPDPVKVNIKIDMLNDISTTPTISYNYSLNIQPSKFKTNLDSYLRTRSPVTFLSELRSYLQQGADPGSHYNIRMLNALVLYVATQALSTINNKQPLMSSITHTAHMDIFQNLAVDLDTEGRYLFLNAMANHLRYPNTHTHYFSYTILYLFAEANSEALQEQIVRVLLERLVANRPHPWGLLVTFLELVRNPNLKLWSREFMSISPDVKRLLATLTHGFPQFPTSPMSTQQPAIVKP
ncbi:unnamed protein product [Rotaria sordida]|uniref:CCR4-NOT transcription complex subunit 1 n=2 Tax=Rotaria sordida TaxID=392033 RepID=A0A819BIV2_9BILA|nr:unnamed protein product [Rotaria sordida]CAF1035371.1 unnamed protein product [Rotaria sordida]CAF1053076.1 unnamed protein product [Rotaria sordida]CAF3797631.1 unnamed protein product [Rotaria sordida]